MLPRTFPCVYLGRVCKNKQVRCGILNVDRYGQVALPARTPAGPPPRQPGTPFRLRPRQHQVLKTFNCCQYNKSEITWVVLHIFFYNCRLFVFPLNVHRLFFLSICISSGFIKKLSLCLSCNKIFFSFFLFGQVTSAFKYRCETCAGIACLWTYARVCEGALPRRCALSHSRAHTHACARAPSAEPSDRVRSKRSVPSGTTLLGTV